MTRATHPPVHVERLRSGLDRVIETELKFQVPAASRQALHKAVATARAVTTRLQAVYADTPARDLAAAGLALRLR